MFERRVSIHRRDPGAAQPTVKAARRRKHLLDPLHGGQHLHRLALAPANIGGQKRQRPEAAPTSLLGPELFDERSSIHQAKIDPLSGQGVNGVGRIANQETALMQQLAGITGPQGEHGSLAEQLTAPQDPIGGGGQRLSKSLGGQRL